MAGKSRAGAGTPERRGAYSEGNITVATGAASGICKAHTGARARNGEPAANGSQEPL